jgi:hypothetical protein
VGHTHPNCPTAAPQRPAAWLVVAGRGRWCAAFGLRAFGAWFVGKPGALAAPAASSGSIRMRISNVSQRARAPPPPPPTPPCPMPGPPQAAARRNRRALRRGDLLRRRGPRHHRAGGDGGRPCRAQGALRHAAGHHAAHVQAVGCGGQGGGPRFGAGRAVWGRARGLGQGRGASQWQRQTAGRAKPGPRGSS